MLSADDAAFAAGEPRLPGLAGVLDAEAVHERVAAAFPELRIRSAVPVYLRFKPGTSCLVGYRLERGGKLSLDAYVRTHAVPGDPKIAKSLASARRRAQGRPAATLLDARTVVMLHPHDHDLPALVGLAEPARRRQLLARTLDASPTADWHLERLRYKPERRWVAQVVDPAGRRMLLKVHRAEEHPRAVAGATAFAALPVRAGRLLGVSRRHRITVHEWVDGTPAGELLAGPDGAATLAAARDVGALLAGLHAIDARKAHRRVPQAPDEVGALGAAVGGITALDPSAGGCAARITAGLQGLARVHGSRTRRSFLHGDCAVDQIVMTDGGPALIDLDQAAHGDPHADVAQLLADLAAGAVRGQATGDHHLAAAVLDGYLDAGGAVDRDQLTRLTAARLVRLALEPFRRRRQHWRHEMHALLDLAARRVDDGVPV